MFRSHISREKSPTDGRVFHIHVFLTSKSSTEMVKYYAGLFKFVEIVGISFSQYGPRGQKMSELVIIYEPFNYQEMKCDVMCHDEFFFNRSKKNGLFKEGRVFLTDRTTSKIIPKEALFQ